MPEPLRVRLVDIARVAGVHLSTVSLALRNSPRLPEATKASIRKIAEKLGYQEDPLLRALASYRDRHRRQANPPTIAYLTQWPTPIAQAPHHRLFLEGARARAAELGFKLEVFSLSDPSMTAKRLGRVLETRMIEGILLSSFYKGAPELDLNWARFCAVRIEMQPAAPAFSTVAVNHAQAIRDAVTHVLRRGYKRPGFMIGDDWSRLVNDEWEMGFTWAQMALDPADRIPIFRFIKSTNGTIRRHRFPKWYGTHKPDVILAPHGVAEERFKDEGLTYPQDVSLVDPFLEGPIEGIAGIVHPLRQVGAAAVGLLGGMLFQHQHGVPPAPMFSYVDGWWVDGASCPAR
ncbi:MAG: LacI family DNA-binding transcriptional regulator [Opitutaceae bacterium]|nr:LacI family DNA-binding transcriptional regulator [Opitutaceae bacterium]